MKPSHFLLTLFIFLLAQASLLAQNEGVSIKSSGGAPDPSAMLDVVSGTKGLLIPRLTFTSITSPAPTSSPADGLLAYNTNTAVGEGKGFYYWSQDAGKWIKLSTGSELWKKIGTSSDIYYDNASSHKVVMGASSPTPTYNLEQRAVSGDYYGAKFTAHQDQQLRFGYYDLNDEAGTGPACFLTQKSGTVDGGGASNSVRYTQLYSNNEPGFIITSYGKNYGTWGQTTMETANNSLFINTQGTLTMQSVGNSAFANLLNTGWSITSDSTLKKNISTEGAVLEKIGQCRPVTYRMKTQGAQTPLSHGLLAQELESIFPELVSNISIPNPENQGQPAVKKSVHYNEMIPILLKAIQEQQALINDLKTRVTALEQH
jgi:hypothetical protein